MNMEQQWEEPEKILSWRKMHLGVYRYHCTEHRGEKRLPQADKRDHS